MIQIQPTPQTIPKSQWPTSCGMAFMQRQGGETPAERDARRELGALLLAKRPAVTMEMQLASMGHGISHVMIIRHLGDPLAVSDITRGFSHTPTGKLLFATYDVVQISGFDKKGKRQVITWLPHLM